MFYIFVGVDLLKYHLTTTLGYKQRQNYHPQLTDKASDSPAIFSIPHQGEPILLCAQREPE